MTTPAPENIAVSGGAPSQTIRDGRYVVVGSLGAGSQGETLDAVDKREGRAVAIKRFQIRGAKSWKDVELAEREATVLASLRHHGLPRYIEHFEEGGALYLVMEKIEGETLASRRKRRAPLDQAQVQRFLREAGECLRYLHGQAPPVVHRDIKPGNVILRPDGSYCLVDFGSVRDRLKPEGGSTVVGTFGFMAPEQFQGRAAPGSDVYAVAATALSLLTGSEPEDLPHKGLAIDVEGALRGQVDRRLIGALRAMLEPDPDRRPSSVAAALQQFGLQDAQPLPGESTAQAAKKARKARLESEQGWGRDQNEGAWAHQSRADRFRERAERRAYEYAEKQRKKAERKAARHVERQARRMAERGWHRPGRPVPPGIFLGSFILLALSVASLATFALFQVLLPTILTIVSIVGGRSVYQSSRRMIEIGQTGQRNLRRAREHIRYQLMGGPTPTELQGVSESAAQPQRARVEPNPEEPRVSVEAELEEMAEQLEAEAHDFVDGRRQRR